jgi:hypothetical protein
MSRGVVQIVRRFIKKPDKTNARQAIADWA